MIAQWQYREKRERYSALKREQRSAYSEARIQRDLNQNIEKRISSATPGNKSMLNPHPCQPSQIKIDPGVHFPCGGWQLHATNHFRHCCALRSDQPQTWNETKQTELLIGVSYWGRSDKWSTKHVALVIIIGMWSLKFVSSRPLLISTSIVESESWFGRSFFCWFQVEALVWVFVLKGSQATRDTGL
jgi:hypothetical protein